ncbi:hypothetical protein VE03_09442 [Pseudogymnoascus sp. 23342-1-I1]|nr:hypothetical protein VE03_09442 [Pseudogymnoascus sp. 23342-1-I1]
MPACNRGGMRAQVIVNVIVGPEGQKFGIHKDQLCTNSAYFMAALEGGFEEAILGEVVLKESTLWPLEYSASGSTPATSRGSYG